MNKFHSRHRLAVTNKDFEMSWVGGELAARVGAGERCRARGAERRAATVADRPFAFRDLASSLCHLDLLASDRPTPSGTGANLRTRVTGSPPGRDQGGSGVGRSMCSPLSFYRVHWDHEPWRACGAGSQACGLGRVSMRPLLVRRTRKPGEPAGWKVCPTSRFMRRCLDATDGARPARHKKRKRQVRRRDTTPVAAHLRRLKQSKNVKRRTPAGKLSAVKSGARSLRGHETVVVVAEHAPSRSVVSRLLKRMGYRVVEAANGMEAQRLAAGEKRIDLLLAEYSALGTTGVELVRWFSANRPEIKVLVAADWLWEVESCLGDLPQVGVLAKQFTPAELARMVRVILH